MSFSLSLDVDLGLGLGPKGARRLFALRLGALGPDNLSVVSFKGRERLSEPFRYDVVFATEASETIVMSSLGHPVQLALAVPGGTPRIVQGLAASLTLVGPAPHERGTDRRRYRVRMVPKLWLLKHRRRNRVFQDKTVVQIARTVLGKAGIAHEFRVDFDDHAPYPFCYQRDETDLAFLHRILATAGIWYCFEHPSGSLESMLPGVGGALSGTVSLAGAGSALAGGLSGALSIDAVLDAAAEPLGLATKLLFLDDPLRGPAIVDGGGDLVSGLLGKGMAALGSAVSDATGGLIELGGPPAATLPFDPAQRLASHGERVLAFELDKAVRPKTVRIHERLVSAHTDKLGVAEAARVEANLTVGLDVGSVLSGGNVLDALHAKMNLDVDLVPSPETVRVDEYGEDPPLQRHPFARAGHDIRYARRSLEQLRRDAMTGAAVSDSRRLAAGYRFKLAEHPTDAVDREYTVTSLTSTGYDPNEVGDTAPPQLYENSFEVVPATVRPRPPKPKRVPRLGLEVAEVVSVPGQDVYCDALGRVQVRFRWLVADDGRRKSPQTLSDDDSTCWIPVVQPWAGPGYGAQFIPRVGTEVLVGFLGGHGERPVVVGALHTEENPVPWTMPTANTKSGIRSRSTPGGEGWSEISIDDDKGHELVFVRAERDLSAVALRDATLSAGRDVEQKAARDYAASATRHLATTAGQDHRISVGGDQTITIGRRRTELVQGARITLTQGERSDVTRGSAAEQVFGSLAESVGGHFTSHTEGDASETVVGRRSLVVGTAEDPQSASSYVFGTHDLFATTLRLRAEEELILEVGESQLRIDAKGIHLVGPTVNGTAKEAMSMSGAGASVKLDGQAAIEGKKFAAAGAGASLTLDSKAVLQGAKVELGSGSGGGADKDKKKETELETVRVALADPVLGPWKNKRFVVTCEGHKDEGKTDGGGLAKFKVPKKAKTAQLRVVLDEEGTTNPVVVDLQLAPTADDAQALALHRLQHLGYFSGLAELWDAQAEEAVMAFQHAHQDEGLVPSGALDDETNELLRKLAGY